MRELTPQKHAFLVYGCVRILFSWLIFSVLIYAVLQVFWPVPFVPIAAALLILASLLCVQRFVSYTKERYTFHDNRIVWKSGGIFSDKEVELVIRHITNVGLSLPFIEHKLFGTGYVRIESAGSGESEIVLSAIDDPREMYEYVASLMQKQGFKLARKRLIQREEPSSIGVFFEVFKNLVSTVFLVFVFFSYGAVELVQLLQMRVVAGVVLVGGIWLLARLILQFLDFKERVYDVYDDTIAYSEGFLTKNYAFIPVENLSDATVSQTLVDKIFGLYDVQLSCQGGAQEIIFKNIVRGRELEKVIDSLVQKGVARTEVHARAAASTASSFGSSFTGAYRMDSKRVFVPFLAALPFCILLFPLLFWWVPAFVRAIIALHATAYSVHGKSIEEKYDFLSGKHKEFTVDKITGVIFKENIIDTFFGTWSVVFWSIGSFEDITFRHITKNENLQQELLKKTGMTTKEEISRIEPAFSVTDFFKANLYLVVPALAVMGVGAVFLIIQPILFLPTLIIPGVMIIAIVYRSEYYKRSMLVFAKNYLHFRRGLVFVEDYYVRKDNVKDISLLRYPSSSKGSATFDVAGEHVVQQGDGQRGFSSNSFKIRYVPDIEQRMVDLDMALTTPSARENPQKGAPLLVSPQELGNSIALLVAAHVVLFPLMVLLPFTLPLLIWGVKMRTYIIEPHRVLARSGIFYKKQISVVFKKIDHVNVREGMLNKLFGNGTITVNTTGSSTAELIVANIRDYRGFYAKLKSAYEK